MVAFETFLVRSAICVWFIYLQYSVHLYTCTQCTVYSVQCAVYFFPAEAYAAIRVDATVTQEQEAPRWDTLGLDSSGHRLISLNSQTKRIFIYIFLLKKTIFLIFFFLQIIFPDSFFFFFIFLPFSKLFWILCIYIYHFYYY